MSPSNCLYSCAATSLAEPPALAELAGPVLVATDGTDESEPALEMGRLLGACGATVEVIAVVEPLSLPPGQFVTAARTIDADRESSMRQRVAQQVADALPAADPPILHTAIGSAAPVIASIARGRRAALVITGLRHHGHIDRMLLRGETPLRIARAVHAPVLVVPVRMQRLPRVVVIATDGEEASINAARRARPLLVEADAVHVVHVRSLAAAASLELIAPWAELFAAVEYEHFERVVAALDLPTGVDVSTGILTGHPVDELLDFAEYVRAELVVTGYRKRLLLDHLPGSRSVAERLYRGTSCAMLLVPEGTAWGADGTDTEVVVAPDEWVAPLQEFSARNVGRPAHVEIDGPELGAQVRVANLPFRGVVYEGATGMLHLTFGRDAPSPMHLTQSIAQPRSVELRRDAQGRDVGLCAAQANGRVLLTFSAAAGR